MYCSLKAYPVAFDNCRDDNHIYLHLVARDEDYSAAVNVASNVEYSKLYYYICDYGEDWFDKFFQMDEGLVRQNKGEGLDYWKDLSLVPDTFSLAEYEKGPNNKLGCKLVDFAKEMMNHTDDFVVVYGKKWGPEKGKDWIFDFEPSQGIHDIHCNQSSPAGSRWRSDDSPGKDGAIFFCYSKTKKVIAVYTMFR